jgi:hypothetical protein
VRVRGAALDYLACFAVLAPLVALWSAATPVSAAPDEPAHVWHGAAVVRGQVLIPTVPSRIGRLGVVTIPKDLVVLETRADCVTRGTEMSASCRTVPRRRAPVYINPPGHGKVLGLIGSAQYPPWYYALVGLPTLVAKGTAAGRAARVVSALLTTSLFALALHLLRLHDTGGAWPLGFAVAITPSCLFLGGVANPSGPEIAAAAALWSGIVCAAREELPTREVLCGSAAAASALLLTRPDGLLLFAVIAALGALVLGRTRAALILARRDIAGPLVVVTGSVIVSAGWLLVAGAPHLIGTPPANTAVRTVARTALLAEGVRFREMIGLFGWNDTPAPRIAVVAWTAVTVLLIVAAAVSRAWKALAVCVCVVAAIVVVQAVSELPNVHTVGYFWTGRYSLPIVLGIPLLTASALPGARLPRWAPIAVAALGAGHVAAFVWVLHRYTTGTAAPLFATRSWQPPGGAVVLTLLFVAAVGVYAVELTRPRAVRIGGAIPSARSDRQYRRPAKAAAPRRR